MHPARGARGMRTDARAATLAAAIARFRGINDPSRACARAYVQGERKKGGREKRKDEQMEHACNSGEFS